MTFRAKKPTVLLKTGKTVLLNGPLILGTRRPAGGWSARFRVKGVDHTLSGKTASEVAKKVMEIHRMNSINLKWEDVWLNLNLQWMDKLDHKYFAVLPGELTDNIMAPSEEPEKTLRKSYSPEQWGSIAWKWMGLFLAQDAFDAQEFLRQMDCVLALLNPNTSPKLGCILCYTEFGSEIGRIRMNPPRSQEEARRFLWEVHNRVNARLSKPMVSWEKACALNFWN